MAGSADMHHLLSLLLGGDSSSGSGGGPPDFEAASLAGTNQHGVVTAIIVPTVLAGTRAPDVAGAQQRSEEVCSRLAAALTDSLAQASLTHTWHAALPRVRVVWPATSEGCSHGMTHACVVVDLAFGDNMEDEWLLTALVQRFLTHPHAKAAACAAYAYDTDGAYLAIEGADELPAWVDPDSMPYRMFMSDTCFHLVPPKPTRACPDALPGMLTSVTHAAAWTMQHAAATRVRPSLGALLQQRLDEASAGARTGVGMQRATVVLPAAAARLLSASPALLSYVVASFFDREQAEVSRCAGMRLFGPRALSCTPESAAGGGERDATPPASSAHVEVAAWVPLTLELTRHQYAQLMLQRVHMSRAYMRGLPSAIATRVAHTRISDEAASEANVEAPKADDPLVQAYVIGYRVALGLEILALRHATQLTGLRAPAAEGARHGEVTPSAAPVDGYCDGCTPAVQEWVARSIADFKSRARAMEVEFSAAYTRTLAEQWCNAVQAGSGPRIPGALRTDHTVDPNAVRTLLTAHTSVGAVLRAVICADAQLQRALSGGLATLSVGESPSAETLHFPTATYLWPPLCVGFTTPASPLDDDLCRHDDATGWLADAASEPNKAGVDAGPAMFADMFGTSTVMGEAGEGEAAKPFASILSKLSDLLSSESTVEGVETTATQPTRQQAATGSSVASDASMSAAPAASHVKEAGDELLSDEEDEDDNTDGNSEDDSESASSAAADSVEDCENEAGAAQGARPSDESFPVAAQGRQLGVLLAALTPDTQVGVSLKSTADVVHAIEAAAAKLATCPAQDVPELPWDADADAPVLEARGYPTPSARVATLLHDMQSTFAVALSHAARATDSNQTCAVPSGGASRATDAIGEPGMADFSAAMDAELALSTMQHSFAKMHVSDGGVGDQPATAAVLTEEADIGYNLLTHLARGTGGSSGPAATLLQSAGLPHSAAFMAIAALAADDVVAQPTADRPEG